LTAKHFLPFGRRDFTFVSQLLFYCFILLFHFFPLLLRPTLRMSYLYLNYWHLKLLLEGDERASGISYLYSISNWAGRIPVDDKWRHIYEYL